MNISLGSLIVSLLALVITAITAWFTLFRRGNLRMTRPTQIFFGPDGIGKNGPLKVYLRTLLYSTAKRAQIVENMFVRVRRSESTQNFNVWVYGESRLTRGSGIRVTEDGVVCNHHFLLPRDGSPFEFLAGEYTLDVYATLVGKWQPELLSRITLSLSTDEALAIKSGDAGVFFDWGPDAHRYMSHIDINPTVRAFGELAQRDS